MSEITVNSTFGQIHDLPEFGAAADFIVPVNSEQGAQMAMAPLAFFAQIGWSPEGMAEGFERISEICKSGESQKNRLTAVFVDGQRGLSPRREYVSFSICRKIK